MVDIKSAWCETATSIVRKICLNFMFQHCLQNLPDLAPENAANYDFDEPFRIPLQVRWRLYKSWLIEYDIYLTNKFNMYLGDQKRAFNEFNSMCKDNTLKLMTSMKVIGMTTTFASRIRETLECLKSPIVIVEEAAQVLESHVVSVLTQHCQHLILIGDHIQLRPSTADYEIETKYHLGKYMKN